MAIMIYNEGDHPMGYIGIRVVVNGSSRVYKQKYFCFRKKGGGWVSMAQEKKLLKEAKELEAEWKAVEARIRLLSFNHIGTKLSFAYKRGRGYPCLAVQGAGTRKDGARVTMTVCATVDRSLSDAWHKLTDELCSKMNWPLEKRNQMIGGLDNIKFWRLNKQRLEFNKNRKEGQIFISKKWLTDRVGAI